MTLPDDIEDRVGTFYLPGELIDTFPEKAMQVLARVIVLRAEYRYERKEFEYIARCADFQPMLSRNAQLVRYRVEWPETPAGDGGTLPLPAGEPRFVS